MDQQEVGPPIALWSMRAGLFSFLLLWTAVPLFVPNSVFGPEMPRATVKAVIWLTLYASLTVVQAGWWTWRRLSHRYKPS